MRNVRDSFLRFLADNLADIPVHAKRIDPNDPDADRLRQDALNVEFLDINPQAQVSSRQVVLDIIHSDELMAEEWMTTIWGVLSSAFYAPVFDYTDPAIPVAVGTNNIIWGKDSIRFRKIYNDNYCHYHCVLPLQFRAS